MDETAAQASLKEGEREKHLRFERLSEIFSYIAIAGGVVLSLLPYQFSFDKRDFYLSLAFIIFFIVCWFRLIPKKYAGETKNFIYALLTLVFIAVVVHFTRGVLSVAIFLFYLTSIGAAASMTLRRTILITLAGSYFIFIETVLGVSNPELGLESLSLGFLQIWGLILTTAFSWLVFQEENAAKVREEKAKIEKVEAVNQVKNEFVFIISNKLREPIVTLQQYLKTASNQEAELTKEQTDLLSKTQENSDRLFELVDDLSDLSKIETGRMRLDLKAVDITNVIGATMSDFTLPAHEKNIRLIYEPPKEKVLVKADSGRLHEIVANLVDNAIKYSLNEKEIRVSLKKK